VATAAVPVFRKSRRVVMTGFSLFADPGCPPGHAVFLFWNFRRSRRMARSDRQPMTFSKPAATGRRRVAGHEIVACGAARLRDAAQ
jgi:hypothetical protein